MGVEFSEDMLDFFVFFGCEVLVMFEIGFGMGVLLVVMVKDCFEQDFFGIEVYLLGVGVCLVFVYEEGLSNLCVMCYDVVEVLYKMIFDNLLCMVQFFFFDLWYKVCYNKCCIVQVLFVELVKSKLQLGGVFYMVTDWEPYVEHMFEVMFFIDGYKNLLESNDYVLCLVLCLVMKFEQCGYCFGYGVWDLMFERVK